MSIRMDTMKRDLDTAVEVKKRISAAEFILEQIENQIRDAIASPDFSKMKEDQKQALCINKARAVKFWRIQLDHYMDQNLASWVNTASRIESEELVMTMEDVLEVYAPLQFMKHTTTAKVTEDMIKDAKFPVIPEPEPSVIPKKPMPDVEEEKVVDEAPDSDDDILASLIASS